MVLAMWCGCVVVVVIMYDVWWSNVGLWCDGVMLV